MCLRVTLEGFHYITRPVCLQVAAFSLHAEVHGYKYHASITTENLPLKNYQQCQQIVIGCTDYTTKAYTVSITTNLKIIILKHEQSQQ